MIEPTMQPDNASTHPESIMAATPPFHGLLPGRIAKLKAVTVFSASNASIPVIPGGIPHLGGAQKTVRRGRTSRRALQVFTAQSGKRPDIWLFDCGQRNS
jgi:hypothetical protein